MIWKERDCDHGVGEGVGGRREWRGRGETQKCRRNQTSLPRGTEQLRPVNRSASGLKKRLQLRAFRLSRPVLEAGGCL